MKMYKSYKSYNKEQISGDCFSRFSPEAIGKQLESIFEEVLSKRKE